MLEALSRLLKQQVSRLERIGGGRNSQVYKVAAEPAGGESRPRGVPRQFALKVYFRHAADNRDRIHAIQLCVGAAFDFHAGNKKMAPAWMQKHSLEWLFRLTQEPGRLWRRYLVTNSIFICLAARRMLLLKGSSRRAENRRMREPAV